MLLQFGLKNFFCFKESVEISFELDNNCPESISKGRGFTTVLCVKGANASGKTQILKGLSFLGWFCSDSFLQKPDTATGTLPYFSSKRPCEFFVDFVIMGVNYRYELAATSTEVKYETIYRTVGKKVKILERKDNQLAFRIAELAVLDKITLRSNASIISSANQYQLKELDNLYQFFSNIATNVTFVGLDENQKDIRAVAEHLSQNAASLDFVKSFIGKCDAGISDIRIEHTKNAAGEIEYFPLFVHQKDKKEYPLLAHTESSGTKTLFRVLPLYKTTLDKGGVLILDEFDTHLHPHILPKLLALFEDTEINKNNAQLLFTTHNSEILNHLGRYKTHLVNKEENASYAYRLDEIPGDILRNDRPILPAYNDGKIGGVPRL